MLPTELSATHTAVPQKLTADPLGATAVAAQFTGALRRLALHSPSPNLSPKGERNMRKA